MEPLDELKEQRDQEFLDEYRESEIEKQWPTITDWSEFI